ncbi:hypothetical protein ACVIJ6_006029 [Bradyrhizobium sp. USDA 4369]
MLLLGIVRAPFRDVGLQLDNPWMAQLVRAIFGVAIPEEIAKIAVIAAMSSRRRQFGNAMDTVFYGAAVGLGFAAYENLAYLVQHAEMWRSLAVLRSILTVPFHGALGIIAGAYLAIARTGTALGAHRHNRDWARWSSWVLVLAAPVALHAAFDYPLLMLQRGSGLDPTARLWLGGRQRADRLFVDRSGRAAGAAGGPSSHAAHRRRARPAEPAATDVGAASARRRRRFHRARLCPDLGAALAAQPRPQCRGCARPARAHRHSARNRAFDCHNDNLHFRPQPDPHDGLNRHISPALQRNAPRALVWVAVPHHVGGRSVRHPARPDRS